MVVATANPRSPAAERPAGGTLHGMWLADSSAMAFWWEAAPPLPAAGTPTRHPGCRAFAELQRALPRELDLFEEERVVLLPTAAGQPLPAGTQTPPPGTQLRAWVVDTGESIADCVFEVLGGLPLTDPPAGWPPWGPSLRYWRLAAAFAQELATSRRVVPGVARLESRHYPAWQAIFDEEAEGAFRRLAAAMPPVCRAVQAIGAEEELQQDPERLLLAFLDAGVDHLLRQRLRPRHAKLQVRPRSEQPCHRQWLQALRAGQLGPLTAPEREATDFGDKVNAWTEFLRPSRLRTAWRLGLELAAPAREDGPWPLTYLLCSAMNPALRLPAEQVWEPGPAGAVSRLAPRAAETLLTDLGVAAELFPPIRASLTDRCPTGCELNRVEAAEFLEDRAALLRRQGFLVVLPPWWDETQTRLHAHLGLEGGGSARDRQALLGVHEVVKFRWQLALGDAPLGLDELQQLARSQRPLVFHRGAWRRLDLNTLNRSLNFLTRHGQQGETTLAKVLRLEADWRREAEGVDIELRLAQLGEQGEAFAPGFHEKVGELALFRGSLRPYQERGLAWLLEVRRLGFGACLADDMGLGKTVQMIALFAWDKERDPGPGPSLVVCPMSVVGNWVKEIARFCPALAVMVHHGSDRETEEEFQVTASRHDVVITTYNLVTRDAPSFQRVHWRYLVLDEAQNVKNPATKQATAARALRARCRFCLTGTPIENRLAELWSILHFLNPGYLGTLGSFRRSFALPIERERDRTRADLLQRLIRPFVLRRLKSDRAIICDLPEKLEQKVYCNLTAEQAALYQAVVDEMLQRLDRSQGMERKGLVLSTLTKLKQITNHPVHFLRDQSEFTAERSGKLQRLDAMLANLLAGGEKALIFSQFTEIGEAMRQHLAARFGVEVLYLHGGSAKASRDEMVQRFQLADGPPLFLLSLKAGGIGLNLTPATHVFHFDRWWNPAIEDQATDRAFRIGQHANVQVHKFIAVGTVEERIDQMIEDKKNLADNIISSGESMLTELSTAELQEAFALSRDAVVE